MDGRQVGSGSESRAHALLQARNGPTDDPRGALAFVDAAQAALQIPAAPGEGNTRAIARFARAVKITDDNPL
jgi:hypothetical protein